jgi:hypothetical protein
MACANVGQFFALTLYTETRAAAPPFGKVECGSGGVSMTVAGMKLLKLGLAYREVESSLNQIRSFGICGALLDARQIPNQTFEFVQRQMKIVRNIVFCGLF